MATPTPCFFLQINFLPTKKPGFCRIDCSTQKLYGTVKFNIPRAKASDDDRNTKPKPKSVICGDCDGNGAVLCSQCKGDGLNSVDFFNGQFKAGDSCWLCGGKKDMLCGNCNGAGFVGGFMNSFDT